MNKKVFQSKDSDGNDLELCVTKPTADVRVKSQLIFNKAFKEAIDNGSILQRQLEEYATKIGLWDEDKQKEVESLQSQIRDLEKKLLGEANSFDSKEAARDCAFDLRKLRWKLINTQQSKNDLYSVTAEAYADDMRVKFFVSQCTLDNSTGKKYFKSYEDYLSQTDSEVGLAAMSAYMELMYSDIGDVENNWVEVKFLRKYGYVDEKNRPINKEGKLIDVESGKLINDKGQYVLDDGVTICDRDGNPLDSEGNYKVDTKPFTDVADEPEQTVATEPAAAEENTTVSEADPA